MAVPIHQTRYAYLLCLLAGKLTLQLSDLLNSIVGEPEGPAHDLVIKEEVAGL